MNVSLNILITKKIKNKNFEKLRHGSKDEGAMIKTTLMSSCHWKTLAHFYLRQKRSEKQKTEKEIMLFKTTVNWLFNYICYLVIAFFD